MGAYQVYIFFKGVHYLDEHAYLYGRVCAQQCHLYMRELDQNQPETDLPQRNTWRGEIDKRSASKKCASARLKLGGTAST